MHLRSLLPSALIVSLCCSTWASMIKLNGGGYEDIVIAIHPNVTEDPKIIENIQNMVKEANQYLFNATKQRLFIKSAKILIPQKWSKNNYPKPKTETYDKADVIIAENHRKFGDDPYTLQYGRCGEPGRYIHLTPDFLVDDKMISVYGPRGRVFVHEWAHLRWGVFDEYNHDKPFYFAGNGKVEATRCSADIIGTYTKQNCQGNQCACLFDQQTGLYEDGCVFVPETYQFVKESIMYLQALPSVSEFCDSKHNREAPTLQNRMCDSRSTWDVIKNSTDITSTAPRADFNIPVPSFSVLQYSERVVSLVLDVSGSMSASNRIGRQLQAAELFVLQIIENGAHLGIVKFSSSASVVSPLVKIHSQLERDKLKSLLPKTAGGGTHICDGIRAGIGVNKKFDGSSFGTEIVLLTDGEDNFDTSLCFKDITDSGAIIHVIALGPNAAKELEVIANMTGGLRFNALDKVEANELIDAFSGIHSGNGEIIQQAIQLESTGSVVKPNGCFVGAVFIDNSVGNETFFLVTWESALPDLNIEDPKRKQYYTADFTTDTTARSSRLGIPGTAEIGVWYYTFCNKYKLEQAITITVTSKPSNVDISPITVSAHMNQDTNNYPHPMVVYASVNQGLLPVIGAKVTAAVQPPTGTPVDLDLLDNGSGADIVKNDGVYSRYFKDYNGNGRYSLKVRIASNKNSTRLALPRSRALYIPGYLENGEVTLNPPRPVINDEELNLGEFSRTASGGSFVVSDVPTGPLPDIYKPEKVTDLEANIEEDTIVLAWTATGDDLDQGTVSRYDLRMSDSPEELRRNFDSCTSVNISNFVPQEAGAQENFTFVPKDIVIANGTILYFALVALDKVPQKSDLSNIAQAALLIPPTPAPTTVQPLPASTTVQKTPAPTTVLPPSSGKLDITILAAIICSAVIIICLIVSITVCIVSCTKKKTNPELRL
ncbi:chloride channel accessory 4 gene 1 L homeolog precursor [Xenopus laevis]|uniref:Calcium activated chloride channel n=1 Tax=Xenopus laevis TaxID=8355 RepID=F7IYU6_XENLA|nr:chloride channel accessory 4 gene 1 L homeolog precursor [Xenopus laevis]BAK40919.1 calcium activated chloride channel [Xenopus laevis]